VAHKVAHKKNEGRPDRLFFIDLSQKSLSGRTRKRNVAVFFLALRILGPATL